MGAFLSWIVATLVIIPFLSYLCIFILVKQITKSHRKAKSFAIDVTTLVLIISVHFLCTVIWTHSYLLIILLGMLILGVVFIFIYRYVRNEIDYMKLCRGYWRLNFLIFSVAYIFLLIYGVTARIVEAVGGL